MSLPCSSCHRGGGNLSDPSASSSRAAGCTGCHRGYDRIFDHVMVNRSKELAFVARSYGKMDGGFFRKNCNGCHVQGCFSCHGDGHRIRRPSVEKCQECHKGYFTGWDYSGRAPRESNMRYQRGRVVNNETFLKMLPDVHYAAGMTCGSCHSMNSMLGGRTSAKGCTDCHSPNLEILEHRIKSHLEKLECFACHSSWAPQEYGSYFLRFRDQRMKEDFDLKPAASPDYLASVYLKSQDSPPLGLNARGRVSPMRPQFISYYTDIASARRGGRENILLAAEWRTYFPHTVQRGTVTCEGCHDNPRRFLLEPESQRIYQLRKDGLGLDSFWLQSGQRVTNGTFIDAERYSRMSARSKGYIKGSVEKWKKLIDHVGSSSRP